MTICIHGMEIVHDRKLVENDLEFYLPSVMAGTIPADYPAEALKAQAVVLRTMLVNTREKNPIKAIESLKLTTKEEWEESMTQAVCDTENEVLYYKDRLIRPAFHALSAGRTRDTSFEYLTAVDSRWDKKNLSFYSKVFISEPKKELNILERDASGYVLRVKFGQETLTGEEFRERFGLNSSNFAVDTEEENWTLTVRGIGHGVGLSQYGAACMAEEGKSYESILKYYFKNTEIRDFYE